MRALPTFRGVSRGANRVESRRRRSESDGDTKGEMIKIVGTAEMHRKRRVEEFKVTVWSPLWREKGKK
jgi:hypothetical protein